MKSRPFGLWESPITARMLSQDIRLTEVGWNKDGTTLIWLEGRSGYGALVAARPGEPGRDLNPEIACQGGVGYGGGEFALTDDTVFFCGKDGRLYTRNLGFGFEQAITPAYGNVASPALSPDGKWVVFVFSDRTNDALAVVDSGGSLWPQKLMSGSDFYMQPAWHPDGTSIAWVEWDHPDMPWDQTRLKMGKVTPGNLLQLTNVTQIAGMENEVIFQPEFSPDGKYLSYITSRGNWDALVLVNLANGQKRDLYVSDEIHLMGPAWVQGMRAYAWQPDGQNIVFIQYQNGFATLWKIAISDQKPEQIPVPEYSWLQQISVSSAGQIALIASSAKISPRVIISSATGWQVIARSTAENVPPEYIPEPKAISWKAEDGSLVHGIYYNPANPNYQSEGLPPAIVYIHGGPTSQTVAAFSSEISYFTSRGYAWLAVNYRGSSGYGNEYRHKLDKNWGYLDVLDAAGAAQALIDQKLANPKQLIIRGGSAGGYTVLNALIRYPGLFKAGICLYGVSNLFLLDQDTHKFEAFYNASLIGTLPEAAKKYHDWSPVFHADKIQDALAIFQGEEDKVVPPSQSEEIVASLQRSGVPYLYKLYPGEGHGFRKQETLLDFYPRVERFLQQNVLFAP